jgi:hypothetical protein
LKFDQEIKAISESELFPKEMLEISAAESQSQFAPSDINKFGDVSAFCISSFAAAEDIANLLGNVNKSSVIIFVKLSTALKCNLIKLILRYIFVKPKNGSEHDLQLKFLWSPLRKRLLANEKAIIELLNKETENFHII